MKTNKEMMKEILRTLGNGGIISHDPTEENPLGQSGVHTFVDDIQDVIEKVMTSPEGYTPPGMAQYHKVFAYALDSDGVEDHIILTAVESNVSAVGRSYLSVNGDNLEIAGTTYTPSTSSWDYILTATESGSLTSRYSGTSAAYHPRSLGPHGLHFRGTDEILRKLGSATTWALAAFIDTDYNWGLIKKIDSDNNYYIVARTGTTMTLLHLANDGTVTSKDTRTCTSDFDYLTYKALWVNNGVGVNPSDFGFGSPKEFYTLPDVWKEIT